MYGKLPIMYKLPRMQQVFVVLILKISTLMVLKEEGRDISRYMWWPYTIVASNSVLLYKIIILDL